MVTGKNFFTAESRGIIRASPDLLFPGNIEASLQMNFSLAVPAGDRHQRLEFIVMGCAESQSPFSSSVSAGINITSNSSYRSRYLG